MPALCTTEVEGTSKLNHRISSCARTFRVGFVALQNLNAMFGVPSIARVTSLGDLSCLKGLRRCAGVQGTRENADQHLRGQILAHDLQARA